MSKSGRKKFISPLIVLLVVFISAVSCVPKNKLVYFNDIDDLNTPVVNQRQLKLIMPFDRLYIRVLSIDPQVSQIFNAAEEVRYGGSANSLIGYIVDEQGNISFPFVGDINIESLTTAQAARKIEAALVDYVSNTSVVVKYVDNQVTVMGEVQRQGVYNFPQDKLTIYEAIGLGGGITRYGDRRNIVLIRNQGEKVMHYRLNLSDSEIANLDYYFIHPNDVIIVEPLNAISTSYQNITFTTVLSSITTLIAILLFTGVSF
jgi:polysaccharide biosynthesis/export protein